MMDEYSDAQEHGGCYVNPFVGEGLYARYLRNWLSIVPKRQMMLLNFDEWTRDAQPTMQAVASFLYLSPHPFKVEKAHNTHLARSVHVGKEGASNVSALQQHSVEDELPFALYCILHEFFAPYNAEFEQLLAEYGFPPMRWAMGKRDKLSCPTRYSHWRTLKGTDMEFNMTSSTEGS